MRNRGVVELAPSCLPELETGCKDGGMESAACAGVRLRPRWSSLDGRRLFKFMRQEFTNDESFPPAGVRALLQGEKERCCNCGDHQNSSESCLSEQQQCPVATKVRGTQQMEEFVNHSTQDLSHHDSCSDATEELQTMNLLSEELYRKANFADEGKHDAKFAKPPTQTNCSAATPPYKNLIRYHASVLGEKHKSSIQHSKLSLDDMTSSGSVQTGQSTRLHGLHQSGVGAPLQPLQENEQTVDLTPEGSAMSIRQGNGDRASATATDFVVSCLCEHILRQQWGLKMQEARLQIQQQRLQELEDLLAFLQGQQEFKQHQQLFGENVWHLKLSGPAGTHCFEGFVEASSLQPGEQAKDKL